MNALLSVILKELRLIKNQKMSLLLIIIYPLLVIGALGLAFGGSLGAQTVDIAVYIPGETELGSFSSEEIMQIIEDTNKANIQYAASAEEAKELVKTGASDFALVVRNEKTAAGQIAVDLLVDNSNFIVSGMFSPIAKASVQMTSAQISSSVIQKLWDELIPVRDKLQGEVGQLDTYLADLEEAEAKINSLQETMQGINVSGLQGSIDKQNQNVDSTKEVLQQFNNDYSSFKADIADTKTAIASADAKLVSYQGKISEQIVIAQEYRNSLASYEQQLQIIANNPLTPAGVKDDLMQLLGQVSQTKQQMDASILELQQVSADIEESRQMVAGIKSKLNEVSAELDSEKQSIDSLNLMLGETTTDISAMNSQLGSLNQTIEEINQLSEDAKATKQDVSAKLENSKVLLGNFMSVLGDLSDVSPAFLSKPIMAFEKKLYEELTPLSFIIPISLALVLLLTCLLFSTVSVLTEKREGAQLRMKLSSTSPAILILGKILGQILFALLVSFLILAIGLLVFNVQLQANILEIIFVIIVASFSFIALGLFITNFTKTQSTAILGSLIIILPMIFLSGTILPLQLMNAPLQLASSLLPLTAANNLFLGALLKGFPITRLFDQVIILIVPALIMIAYTIKKF